MEAPDSLSRATDDLNSALFRLFLVATSVVVVVIIVIVQLLLLLAAQLVARGSHGELLLTPTQHLLVLFLKLAQGRLAGGTRRGREVEAEVALPLVVVVEVLALERVVAHDVVVDGRVRANDRHRSVLALVDYLDVQHAVVAEWVRIRPRLFTLCVFEEHFILE